jgi:CRISPR-associated protein Cas1
MVKRTLHFSNPAYLSCKNQQLVVELKDEEKTKKTIPIEDIGVVILEHPQITITSRLMEELLANKVSLITCNSKFMPSGLFLPLEGNSEQTERFRTQVESSVPLKKQLWQQTVKTKIENQARVLESLGEINERLNYLKDKVQSGDPTNCEGQAAAFYWGKIYGAKFTRTREGDTPNAQLNYGYAILRSVVARAIVSTGMMPSFGIFHRNKYNAFCLADDIMEPYRPYVDWLVLQLDGIKNNEDGLTREHKIELLKIPQIDVEINGVKKPLFHAVSTTTASLYKCFAGESRKISYPTFKP